jgi:hypothetical protein
VDHVVIARDNASARIAAPDPRYFALHKLWMAEKAGRNLLKRPKYEKQGMLLLDAVAEAMPHYPMDKTFVSSLLGALLPYSIAGRRSGKESEHHPGSIGLLKGNMPKRRAYFVIASLIPCETRFAIGNQSDCFAPHVGC